MRITGIECKITNAEEMKSKIDSVNILSLKKHTSVMINPNDFQRLLNDPDYKIERGTENMQFQNKILGYDLFVYWLVMEGRYVIMSNS